MNDLSWLTSYLSTNGFDIPDELRLIVDRGTQDQIPLWFSTEADAIEDTERMNDRFRAHHVLAFGRRGDYDGVICLVLTDGVYPRGHVIVLHWDGWPDGTEVDDEFASLDLWAKAAEAEIQERIGWALDPSTIPAG